MRKPAKLAETTAVSRRAEADILPDTRNIELAQARDLTSCKNLATGAAIRKRKGKRVIHIRHGFARLALERDVAGRDQLLQTVQWSLLQPPAGHVKQWWTRGVEA